MRTRFLSTQVFAAGLLLLCTGCPMPPEPDSPSIALQRIAQGLTAPIGLEAPDDGTGRLFIVDQIGTIRVVESNGALRDTPLLDLRSRMVTLDPGYDERGLLGLALHPNYRTNGRLFVFYSAPRGDDIDPQFDSELHISEFRISTEDANRADAASERVLLRIPKPQGNHNGGQLAFGPDGFLYIGVGDGGGGGDTGFGHKPDIGNGQDKSTLLGKILRIDIDRGDPYAVPADNPFTNETGARPEIWAYGLRNPWRFSFDVEPGTGRVRLFAGDVGQNLFEEVDLIERSGNYGWNRREGDRCFDPTNRSQPPANCATTGPSGEPLVEPILAYAHASPGRPATTSVIGGFLYRGQGVPSLRGSYVFGDYSSAFIAGDGALYVASESANGTWTQRDVSVAGETGGRIGRFILAFGRDAAGEIYVLTSRNSGPTGTTGEAFRFIAPP